MGLRFRKSIKIAPGVKLNLGKKSAGISIGGKYSGVSVNSKTGVRVRASAPGTGLSYSAKLDTAAPSQSGKASTDPTGIPEQMDMESGEFSENTGRRSPSGGGFKKLLRWILALFMVVGALLYMPSFSSILFLLFAVCAVPIPAISDFLAEKLHLKKGLKAVVMLVLFFAAFLNAPDIEHSNVSAPADGVQQLEPAPENVSAPAEKPTPADAEEPITISQKDPAIPDYADVKAAFENLHDGAEISVSQQGSMLVVHILCGDLSVDTQPENWPDLYAAAAAATDESESFAKNKYGVDMVSFQIEDASGAILGSGAGDSLQYDAFAAPPEEETISQQEAKTNEKTVYVTPTGSRYHYNSNCGNGSYSSTTLSNAKAMGLTPCKKCAGG